MNQNPQKIKGISIYNIFIVIALLAAFWTIESLVDITFFHPGTLFIDSFMSPDYHELWMRLLFVGVIVVSYVLYRNIQRNKQVEKELVESKRKYERFFTTVPNGWALHKIIVDENNKPVDYIFLEVNEAYEKLTGLKSKNIIGKRVTEVLPGTEKDPADWIETFGNVALTGKEIKLENYSEAIGKWYNISASCPEKGYFIVVFDDITERRQSEEALRRSERNLNNITSNLAEGLYVFDDQGKIVFINPEAERLLGWTIDELNEKGPHDLVHYRKADGSPLPLEECNMHKVITTGRLYTSTDEVFVRKDGTVFPISVITSPIMEDGRVIASVTAFRDITERKDIERKLETLAVTDELTGLLNRRGFMTFAEKQHMIAVRHKRKLALIYIDLDGLKIINDELGHEAGDQAIADTAEVLRKTFRTSDILGRIGGDEFAVLLTETSDHIIENVINSHLKNNLNSLKEQGGRKFELLLSMGIAYFNPDNPCALNELISTADQLMYENKKLRVHVPAQKKPMTDNRRQRRYKVHEGCRVTLNGSGEFPVKNISIGGICLYISRYLSSDEIHRLKILSPDNNEIALSGKVIWCYLREDAGNTSYHAAGLNFIEMDESATDSLNELVRNSSPE